MGRKVMCELGTRERARFSGVGRHFQGLSNVSADTCRHEISQLSYS